VSCPFRGKRDTAFNLRKIDYRALFGGNIQTMQCSFLLMKAMKSLFKVRKHLPFLNKTTVE
jgi:hypothetical protein